MTKPVTNVSTRAYSYVQPIMEQFMQAYNSQGVKISKEEYENTFNILLNNAIIAESNYENKNIRIKNFPEKRTEIETEYNKESFDYYKNALQDELIDFKEMAGMPVELRKRASEYASKGQITAMQNATRQVESMTKQLIETKKAMGEEFSTSEIQQIQAIFFQNALKSELSRLKDKEIENVFGT